MEMRYKPAQAKKITIHRIIKCTGTIKAQTGAEVKVGARVSGRLEKLFVEVGQKVKKDQIVAVIDTDELQARLKEAEAQYRVAREKMAAIQATMPKEIARARAALKEARAEKNLANISLKRKRSLKKQGYVTAEQVDDVHRQFLVGNARLVSARENLSLFQSKMKADLAVSKAQVYGAWTKVRIAKISLEYATIKAPIDGVVASVSTRKGETVAASFSAPTFITIVDLTRLQVDASVDETDIGTVRAGQVVTFTVDAFPKRIFKGRIRIIQPQATILQDVVYYLVEVDILTPYKGLLRPQMTANVSIQTGTRKDVVAVPGRAVRRLPSGKAVVQVPGELGLPRSQPIQVGWSEKGWTEIRKGLKPGDEVLIPKPRSQRRKRPRFR